MIDTHGKTLQEVVDEIAAKLIEQKVPCRNEETRVCFYGDDNGNHCAIGWLLPEDREDLMGFNGTVRHMMDRYGNLGPNDNFIRRNALTLNTIQKVHDKSQLTDVIPVTDFDNLQRMEEVDLEKFLPFFVGETV